MPKKVDYQFLARLCARHASGDYYHVAARYAACQGLTPRQKLRLQRVAQQEALVQQAAERSLQALDDLLRKQGRRT